MTSLTLVVEPLNRLVYTLLTRIFKIILLIHKAATALIAEIYEKFTILKFDCKLLFQVEHLMHKVTVRTHTSGRPSRVTHFSSISVSSRRHSLKFLEFFRINFRVPISKELITCGHRTYINCFSHSNFTIHSENS